MSICLLLYVQIENLLDQLRDKEKQLAGLKDRVKSLQTDTSNTDTALGTLEEALAEKVHTHTHTHTCCWSTSGQLPSNFNTSIKPLWANLPTSHTMFKWLWINGNEPIITLAVSIHCLYLKKVSNSHAIYHCLGRRIQVPQSWNSHLNMGIEPATACV